jgi:arginyl-tRNA synthetase
MGTLSSDGLQAVLQGVGIETPVPLFPPADTQNYPMAIYLSYLAEILVQLTGCAPQVAYESIQWPNELGDLVVVLPRLRVKDVNPNALAVDLKKRVGWHALNLYNTLRSASLIIPKLVPSFPPFQPSIR